MTTPINKILTNHKQTLSVAELANVSASLSAILGQGGGGGGGEPCASAWLPSVDENGNLSWTLSMSTTTPDTANIMGPQGPNGRDGAKGKDGTSIILQSVTDVAGGKQVTLAWGETPSTSSFVIPSGTPGTPGVNGVSPTVTITDAPTTEHPQGGKTVTITDADHPAGQSFDIWNGIDGQGATVNLVEGDGIQITHEAGTTNYTIGVSADYALKSELPDVTDMATKTWVGDQGFLKSTDLTEYATKTYANEASAYALSKAETYADSTSAEALSQAKSWVEQQSYLPTSGGTVSGQLVVSGSAFDTLELKRSDKQTSTGIIGINGDGGMSFKAVNPNGNTQLNIAPNATMDKRLSIGDDVYHPSAYLIPAVTATTTAGLTDDGILHIIVEN